MNKVRTKYLLVVIVIFFMVCCSPEAGKKTLNFFFDGAPGEDIETQFLVTDSLNLIENNLTIPTIPPKPQIVYHLPYLEKECATCHDYNSMGGYVLAQPKLCYQCHEDFKESYNIVHGPVAGGYCTSCHHPHFTKKKGLLKRSGQELCIHCHIPGESFNMELHDGIEDTDCTECHNPHGGETRLMFN